MKLCDIYIEIYKSELTYDTCHVLTPYVGMMEQDFLHKLMGDVDVTMKSSRSMMS